MCVLLFGVDGLTWWFDLALVLAWDDGQLRVGRE